MARPKLKIKYNGWTISRSPKEYIGFVDLSKNLGAYELFNEDRLLYHIKRANRKAIVSSKNRKGYLVVEATFKAERKDWKDNIEEGKRACDLFDNAIKSFE